MGLLRACADAVLVGSGTMLASPRGTWRPERVYPPAADAFAELRRRRGRPERPTVAFVTAGGSFDPAHPALEEPAIVLTTTRAAVDIRATVPAASEVVAVNDGDSVDLQQGLVLLHERGYSLVLSEGGPPLLAGRADALRLALVDGVELLPEHAARARLRSVRRHADHLFLRYALAK